MARILCRSLFYTIFIFHEMIWDGPQISPHLQLLSIRIIGITMNHKISEAFRETFSDVLWSSPFPHGFHSSHSFHPVALCVAAGMQKAPLRGTGRAAVLRAANRRPRIQNSRTVTGPLMKDMKGVRPVRLAEQNHDIITVITGIHRICPDVSHKGCSSLLLFSVFSDLSWETEPTW